MSTQTWNKLIKSGTGHYWKSRTRICLPGLCVGMILPTLNYNGLWILFVQIPAFKKAVDNDYPAATSSDLKPQPALAVVQLHNSRFGLGFYRCSYAVFALSLLLVFYPFIHVQPLWVLALAACWSGLWWVYRTQRINNVTGLL